MHCAPCPCTQHHATLHSWSDSEKKILPSAVFFARAITAFDVVSRSFDAQKCPAGPIPASGTHTATVPKVRANPKGAQSGPWCCRRPPQSPQQCRIRRANAGAGKGMMTTVMLSLERLSYSRLCFLSHEITWYS